MKITEALDVLTSLACFIISIVNLTKGNYMVAIWWLLAAHLFDIKTVRIMNQEDE